MTFFSHPTKDEQLILWKRYWQARKSKNCTFLKSPTHQVYQFRFLKNKEVIYFEIPKYPELATKNIWPLIKENDDLMAFFPDLKELQLPEKEFMYGILCTLRPDSVRELIATGVKNRSPTVQEDKGDLIEITKELKDSIMDLYSLKSKYFQQFTLTLIQPLEAELTFFWKSPLYSIVKEDLPRNIMPTSKNSLNTELKTTNRKTTIPMKRSKIQMTVFNLSWLKFMLFKN